MRTTLLTQGRARPPFAEAEAHYLKLLRPRQPLDVVEARDAASMLRRVPERCRLVAIDGGGRQMTSEEWSEWLAQRRIEALDLVIAVGGPDGLPPELRERADELISLGAQTMAHQLARVIVCEQLFRAAKILAGEAYHR